MVDQRKLKRLHVVSYLKITQQLTDETIGHVVDITTEGMRLCGDQPIMPNKTYRFKMILPDIPRDKNEICFEANVIWCEKDKVFDIYDAGIQLVKVSPPELELIEEFIHKATFEERWLSGIESRPERPDKIVVS